MSYSAVIREKCKDVGEFIDLSLAELKLMPLSPGIVSNELIQHLKQQSWSWNNRALNTRHFPPLLFFLQ